jgi:hypothetical protein
MVKTLILISLLAHTCSPGSRTEVDNVSDTTVVAGAKPVRLEFWKDIQPILQAHCTPCHFKDGKMYQRMPFDQPKTLVDFQDGILRRLKDKPEVEKIRQYLAEME